jgi:hypothetical protein
MQQTVVISSASWQFERLIIQGRHHTTNFEMEYCINVLALLTQNLGLKTSEFSSQM